MYNVLITKVYPLIYSWRILTTIRMLFITQMSILRGWWLSIGLARRNSTELWYMKCVLCCFAPALEWSKWTWTNEKKGCICQKGLGLTKEIKCWQPAIVCTVETLFLFPQDQKPLEALSLHNLRFLPLKCPHVSRMSWHAKPLYRLNSTFYNETKGINRTPSAMISSVLHAESLCLKGRHQELSWHLGPASRPSPRGQELDPEARYHEHLKTNCWWAQHAGGGRCMTLESCRWLLFLSSHDQPGRDLWRNYPDDYSNSRGIAYGVRRDECLIDRGVDPHTTICQ